MGGSTKRGSLVKQMTFSKWGWEKLPKVPLFCCHSMSVKLLICCPVLLPIMETLACFLESVTRMPAAHAWYMEIVGFSSQLPLLPSVA